MNTALLHSHSLLAVISGLWFAGRAGWRLGLQKPIQRKVWRIAPHVMDTLLLGSGLALAAMLQLSPHAAPWFAVKLILVVVYIGLGILAFRLPQRGAALVIAGLAFVVWFWLLGLALNRSALGWLV